MPFIFLKLSSRYPQNDLLVPPNVFQVPQTVFQLSQNVIYVTTKCLPGTSKCLSNERLLCYNVNLCGILGGKVLTVMCQLYYIFYAMQYLLGKFLLNCIYNIVCIVFYVLIFYNKNLCIVSYLGILLTTYVPGID
jgi:hypothetical protein